MIIGLILLPSGSFGLGMQSSPDEEMLYGDEISCAEDYVLLCRQDANVKEDEATLMLNFLTGIETLQNGACEVRFKYSS